MARRTAGYYSLAELLVALGLLGLMMGVAFLFRRKLAA